MDELRKPLFWVAMGSLSLTLLVETGSPWLARATAARDRIEGMEQSVDTLFAAQGENVAPAEQARLKQALSERATSTKGPPGRALRAIATFDGLFLLLAALIAASLIVPERVHVKYQAVVMLVACVLTLVMTIQLISVLLVELMLMVGLFTAAPFGTLVYLAKWGFFDRGGAAVILGIGMTLKLTFAGLLIAAHQRFLQNKGLMLLTLTSLGINVLTQFLHGWAPIFLVSITDAIAALIICIVTAIWAIIVLIGAIIGLFKLIF